ncbi:hypothetical protein C8F01DRAFT_988508 [Mycena amicta]|nr:hypothetical protein C8F01DRAFT_988508 [Mycena amicta]
MPSLWLIFLTQVIFARGTTESGTIGETVGPSFLNSTLKALAKANEGLRRNKGVPYPASVEAYFDGGSPQSSATVLQQVASQCPTSVIISTGYRQDGQLVHNSAQILARGPNIVSPPWSSS